MLPSAVGGNFDVVAPDQRGYGQTTPMASAGSEGREGGDWREYAYGRDGDDLVDVCALNRVADLASLAGCIPIADNDVCSSIDTADAFQNTADAAAPAAATKI
eukprot:gene27414-27825_t